MIVVFISRIFILAKIQKPRQKEKRSVGNGSRLHIPELSLPQAAAPAEPEVIRKGKQETEGESEAEADAKGKAKPEKAEKAEKSEKKEKK